VPPADDGKPPARKRRRTSRGPRERERAASTPAVVPDGPVEAAVPTAAPGTAENDDKDASPVEAVAEPETRPAEPAKPDAEALELEPDRPEAEVEAVKPKPADDDAPVVEPEPAAVHTKAAATEGGSGPADAAVKALEPPEPVAVAPAPAPLSAVEADGSAPARLYELAWSMGVLTVAALARKELSTIFRSPVPYVVGAVVIILTSIFGYLPQVNANAPVTMAGVFSWLALMMGFFTPLTTMQSLAGELRSGTLEQLLTSPIRFWELVAGKWLGGFLFYATTVSFTLVYVILMSAYQQAHTTGTILGMRLSLPSVDYGSVFTGYVGVLLIGAAWVALGLLASSLTRNQIIAAVVGIVTLVALQYGFGALAAFVTPPLSDVLDYLAASSRAQSFNQGQIVLRDLVYFVTLSIGALFVTIRIIESKKWR
jgi:ABC-2 type transport system permease protein